MVSKYLTLSSAWGRGGEGAAVQANLGRRTCLCRGEARLAGRRQDRQGLEGLLPGLLVLNKLSAGPPHAHP